MPDKAHKPPPSSALEKIDPEITGVDELNEALIRSEARVSKAESELFGKELELRALRENYSHAQERLAEVLAENRTLRFWLSRYKAVKDRYLPRGGFWERAVKRVALKLITRRTPRDKLQKFAEIPVKNTNGSRTLEIVEPPQDWRDDPHRPPIVIVIPNWNRVELLRRCLDAIFGNTEYDRYRICVYDQGSSDGSKEYLQSLGNRIDAILASENIGFLQACNRMIRRYPKWDVVFLNNDTEVTEGWLEPLVETAHKADKIGMLGPKLIYVDGRLQEAGSQVFQDGSCRAHGKYESPDDPAFNQLREVDYCSAACLYVKRAVLDRVGGFDQRYSPAYYEDTDLAFEARAAGFRTVCEPRSTVIHHEYASAGQTAMELMEANRSKFFAKWKDVLPRQQRSLWAAASPDRRETVLVISELVPAPDRSSGGTRLYELLLLLGRHYHVVLAYLGPESLRDYVKPLERLGVTAFYRGYAKAVHNYDVDLAAILANNQFKFVFCELFDVAEHFVRKIREVSPHSIVVIDTFDVHYLRETREAQISGVSILEEKAQATRKRELQIYSQADLVLTVTQNDRKVLLRDNPKLNVAVVSNIHAIPETTVPRDQRCGLLFVGGFSHRPNVDAVLYFCREVLPLVRIRLPNIKFHVVGNAPTVEIIALGSANIAVTGYVPNLTPYLDSALVSVVPLRFGSGMKGKIGEAMAHGLPVVTTSIGAEGMYLTDGLDAMIGDTPEEFATRVIRLHQDAHLWESVAQSARIHAERWSPGQVDIDLSDVLAQFTGCEKERQG